MKGEDEITAHLLIPTQKPQNGLNATNLEKHTEKDCKKQKH
jgi:hypothetical protein